MDLSFFSDWVEEELFGQGELAGLIADIVDEATACDSPGELSSSEEVDRTLLESAWRAAEKEGGPVRARAAVVLGRLGCPGVEQGLEEARKSDDSSVAVAAAIVLARIGEIDDGLLQGLLRAVNDPAQPREIRSAAARAVGAESTFAAITELVKIAWSEDLDLAQYGVEGLGVVKPESDSEERRAALEALIAALHKEDQGVRMAALAALGDFGDPAAVKHLEMILIEKDPAIRRQALFALAKLGARSAKAPLTRMLTDSSIPARWEIADLLGEQYGESIIDALTAAAKDRDAEVREHVVAALGRMDGSASRQLLEKIAHDDSDRFVREHASTALARREPEPASGREQAACEAEAATPVPKSELPPPPPESAPSQKVGVESWEGGLSKLQPLYQSGGTEGPGGLPEKQESANVIERALGSVQCSWQRVPRGYRVEVSFGKGVEEVDIFLGGVDHEGSPVYRFIAKCGPVRAASYETALRNNRLLDYGALAINYDSGSPMFVLTHAVLAENASVAVIRKIIASLVRAAARLRAAP